MKKLISIIAVVVFAAALLLSFNSNIQKALQSQSSGPAYASLIPIPPPPPKPKGC